jgi:hypothetical protein
MTSISQTLERIRNYLRKEPVPSDIIFVDWDWRPAVLYPDELDGAFAILKKGGRWTRVDWDDVSHTGGVMSEAKWRARFEPVFGRLDLSKLPRPRNDQA